MAGERHEAERCPAAEIKKPTSERDRVQWAGVICPKLPLQPGLPQCREVPAVVGGCGVPRPLGSLGSILVLLVPAHLCNHLTPSKPGWHSDNTYYHGQTLSICEKDFIGRCFPPGRRVQLLGPRARRRAGTHAHPAAQGHPLGQTPPGDLPGGGREEPSRAHTQEVPLKPQREPPQSPGCSGGMAAAGQCPGMEWVLASTMPRSCRDAAGCLRAPVGC